jgi:hypothetical protein
VTDQTRRARESGWIAEHRETYLQDGAAGHLRGQTFAGGPGQLLSLLLFTTGGKSGPGIEHAAACYTANLKAVTL